MLQDECMIKCNALLLKANHQIFVGIYVNDFIYYPNKLDKVKEWFK